MLSPYKLYKLEKPLARVPVTAGPRGKPRPGSSGTKCYNSYNIDWTVHRLLPTLYEQGKPGGVKRKSLTRLATLGMQPGPDKDFYSTDIGWKLRNSSPRWGLGVAPGRRQRLPVGLVDRGEAQVSKKTKAAVGTGVGAAVYGTNKKKLDSSFSTALGYSHPKYKKKIKKGAYTRYVY